MNASGKIKTLSITTIILPGMLSMAWLIGALLSNRPLSESLMLVSAQSVLAFFTFGVLAKTLPRQQTVYGPRLIFVIGLHVLIYYGLSNIIPALLSELRPQGLIMSVLYRIPVSPAWAYFLATIAAALMLLGIVVGSSLAFKVWPLRCSQRRSVTDSYIWLPGYKLAMRSCVVLLALIVVGTIQYGIHILSTVSAASPDVSRDFSLYQQLFFHGLFWFLPIAPMLAAAALVQATMPRQRKLALWFFAGACLMTFIALSIWGKRSTAMLALAMPLGLFIYAGKVDWRKIVLPAVGLIIAVYGAVTIVRGSAFLSLLSQASDITQVSISEAGSALMTIQNETSGVAQRALTDFSYRTAGLEGVAALIQAQTNAQIPLKWGKTIQAGFIQALPVSLRPADDIPERIKAAPANLGVFQPGDWVETVLAELVLDFGPFFLLVPAVIVGFGLGLVDRTLLGLGQRPALEGLLILRLAFLLYIISNGGSFSDMTLMFFKATIGYTALFLLLGNIGRIYAKVKWIALAQTRI